MKMCCMSHVAGVGGGHSARVEPGVAGQVVMSVVERKATGPGTAGSRGISQCTSRGRAVNGNLTKPVKRRERRKEVRTTTGNINCKYKVR